MKDNANEVEMNEDKTSIKIKHSTLYKIFGFIIVAIVVVMLFYSFSGKSTVGNVIAAGNGNVQIVKMKVQGLQYVMDPATFKVGVPVRIVADIAQMPGCSKSVLISAFGIRKTLTDKDNVIEFTPDKTGTFNIACGMNMYKGTFTVLQSDGSKSSYVETALAAGHTCGGSSGGGCGCGG